MQNSELTRETVSAVEWRFVTVAVQFVVQFGVQLALARLLAPEAFGVVAIALVFAGLAATISETGLSPAVVQPPVLTDRSIQISLSASMRRLLGHGAGPTGDNGFPLRPLRSSTKEHTHAGTAAQAA